MATVAEVVQAVAAVVFVALALFGAVFQLALVFGAPYGELTLGGRYWEERVLPAQGRVMAGLSAVLLSGMAFVALVRPALWFSELGERPVVRGLVWATAGYCVLGVVMNAATPSKGERRIWLPIVSAMLVAILTVAVLGVAMR